MYCKNCGSEISNNAFICPKCGVKTKDDPVFAMAPNAGGGGAGAASSSSSSSVSVSIDGNKSTSDGKLAFPIATLLCYILLYPIGFILNIVGLFSGEKKGCFLSLFITFFILPLIGTIFFVFVCCIAAAAEENNSNTQATSNTEQVANP